MFNWDVFRRLDSDISQKPWRRGASSFGIWGFLLPLIIRAG
jgi:hypothetical protein